MAEKKHEYEVEEEIDYSALIAKWSLEEGPVKVVVDNEELNENYGSKSFRSIPGHRGPIDFDKKENWPASPEMYVESVDNVRTLWNDLLNDDVTREKLLQSVPIEDIESEFERCGVKKTFLDDTRLRMLRLVGRDEKKRTSLYRKEAIHRTSGSQRTIEQTVPDPELFAIGAYTEKYAYTALNKSLWENKGNHEFPGFSRTLIKALRHLPYVWDITLYHGGLRTEKLETLVEGDLVTWKGFMSTSSDKKIAEIFLNTKTKEGHCLYEITAWNGRKISDFSKYRYEKEVLLPPYSLFQINGKTTDGEGNLVVQMEEMLIWRGSKCVLWVDDKHMNNKLIMEKAELSGTNFVLATSTDEAIRFMLFKSHKELMEKHPQNLRIITDMSREEDGDYIHDAGCRLISQLRQIGYNETVMVFGNREASLKEKLTNNGIPLDKIIVTRDFNEAYKFCTFNVKSHLGRGNPVVLVNIHKCRNLAAKDLNGYSDPYCVIDLIRNGELFHSLGKTDIVEKDLNPTFSRTSFHCVLPDPNFDIITQLTLRITVMDKDKYKKDDFLGVLYFNLAMHQCIPLRWFKLHKRPKKRDNISGDIYIEYQVEIPVDDDSRPNVPRCVSPLNPLPSDEDIKNDDEFFASSPGIGGEEVVYVVSDENDDQEENDVYPIYFLEFDNSAIIATCLCQCHHSYL